MRLPERFTHDAQLDRRIRELLGRLSMVNEAQGSSVLTFGSVSSGKHESRPPRGVRMKRSVGELEHAPRHRFLYDYFLKAFAEADSDTRLRKLCVEAEIDLGDRHRLPTAEQELTVAEREVRLINTLIEHGEGIHCVDLAAEEQLPIGWVQKIREERDRDATFGRWRPDFKAMTKREREDICRQAKADGMNPRETSEWLGVGRTTIQRYWPKAALQLAEAA